MSKDKYRPSISADEVIRRDIPTVVPTGATGGGGFEDGTGDIIDDELGTVDRTAPKNLRIVSQTPYYTPEGQQFVEVVVAWDPVPGATEYLVRVGIG